MVVVGFFGSTVQLRSVGTGGGQFFADQLTLSQPRGRLCPPNHFVPPHPRFLDFSDTPAAVVALQNVTMIVVCKEVLA